MYWQPLYWFARYRGASPANAEDLTQGFFEDLLRHGTIARASPDRGRFRTFLLSSFRNFQSHERERASSIKRGGGHEIVSIEAMREAGGQVDVESTPGESPDKAFDRKWAVTLLQNALAAMGHEYAAAGKAALFDELKVVLWGGRGAVSYVEIAARLSVTEGAIKVAMFRARRRFREQLGAEVAKTLLDPAEIDDELRQLFAALAV
jgi:RNA polymerase sigma-70 factor (ECF subfamily)